MALIGYARVSTDDQDLILQIEALERAGVESRRIYTDTRSAVAERRCRTATIPDSHK